MITARGVILVVVAIFIYLLARLTHLGWLYLLDAPLWGTILLSLTLPWIAWGVPTARLRMVRHGQGTVPGPSEGEVVELELELENRRRWPSYLISVSYYCPLASPDETWQRFFVPRLGRGASAALVSRLKCHHRGLYEFGTVIAESKAPFGLFRRRSRLTAPISILVYPLVYPLRRVPLLARFQGIEPRPRRIRQGDETAGSRHYFPGDPLRNIHWRNTARLGRPMVKEFEDTQEASLAIVFDSGKEIGQGQETTLEYCIKLAASVSGCVIEQGRTVCLVTGNLPAQQLPWPALLRELSLLEAGDGPGLPGLLEALPPGAPVLAFVSESDSQGIDALVSRACLMSGVAAVVLEGFEGQSSQTVGASARLRENGVPTVACSVGNLRGALESIQDLSLHGPPVFPLSSKRTRVKETLSE